MSKQVKCQRDVRNEAILQETLKELNINATQAGDKFSWGSGYGKMSIDVSTGSISYDDMHKAKLDNICKTYSKNLVRDSIIKKGHKIKSQKVLSDGRIEIIASY